MHVLHNIQLYHPVPSGAARYFVEIGERLVHEGHRVTVLTTDAFDLEHLWASGRRHIAEREDMHNGVHVRRFPVTRVPGSPILYPVIRRLMVEIARLPMPHVLTRALVHRMALLTPRLPDLAPFLATSPALADVALVHSTNITLDFAILPVLHWAQQRSIPHICTPFTHLGEPTNRQIVRYYTMPHQIEILRQSATVITQTGLEQQWLQRKGVPAERMQTIGVGVTPAALAGGNAQRFRQQHAVHGPIVLTIGVAAYDKGTFHTVQAMQHLWQQGYDATWVQIGPMMSHFEKYVASLPASDRAHMRILGFVPDQVRHDALAAASVFVLPSRTDSFGIVYLEAWVYGLPVIGAEAGGVPEVITHGTNGILIPFGDTTQLANAIKRLLDDQTLAQAFGTAGRATVLRRFTWDHIYAQVREVYERAVVATEEQE